MASPNTGSEILNKKPVESVEKNSPSFPVPDDPEDSGFLYNFLNILFKYGHAILALSYTIGKSSERDGKAKYFIRKDRMVQRIFSLIYTIVCTYGFFILIGEKFAVTKYCIINWIKRGTHAVFLVQLVVVKYCLEKEETKNILLKIFSQADKLQLKLANSYIIFPEKKKVKLLAYGITGVVATWSVMHVGIFISGPEGTSKYARHFIRASTLNLINFEMENLSSTVTSIAGFLGTAMEVITSIIFYFGDAVAIFFVIAVWIIFQRLNCAFESGNNLGHRKLAEVMNLHLSATHLIYLTNEILSTVIFCSTLYTILYTCFWTNHFIQSETFRRIHIVCIVFILKNAVILLLAADVNNKAHKITYWLEKRCQTNPESLVEINPILMSVWTCQLYNRDTIGFKGLNYFTITSCFISGTVGLVIAYTAVVVQLIPH